MRYLSILLLTSFFYSHSAGQSITKGKISGKVIDAGTKAAVDYATISVMQQGSTKPLNGAAADEKGNFVIANLPNGEYTVSISFIGYQKRIIEHLLISAAKPTVNLGAVPLVSAQRMLKDVTVTAKALVVENRVDKLVYNAANDITSQGGVALDVLKKVPQVSVDVDGNVELQGDPNVRFLINGKPSSLFGTSVTDALSNIPASQIKSIEVITSPGAKYDAEGTGGIINIILKDNKVQGINGSVNLSAGTRLENGSANLNIKHGDLGVSAFFSGNEQINTRTKNSQNQLSSNAAGDTLSRRIQNGYTDLKRNGYQTGISFDWNITPKDNITAAFSFNHFGNSNTGLTAQQDMLTTLAGRPVANQLSNRISTSNFNAHSIDYSLSYHKTFRKEGQELVFLYNSSLSNNESDYTQVQYHPGIALPFSGANSASPGSQNETDISLDYTQPISKHFTLEAGAKAVLQTIRSMANVNTLDTVSQQYGFDPLQSYSLYYNRKVYAGYLSASFSLFNFFDVKAGARYERTNTTIDFPNTVIPPNNTFAPSAVISHNFKNGQTLKVAYTRRIQRPDFRDLNPFQNLSDPYNITTGNPLLQPEIGDNYELGYNKSFEKGGNIYIALFARHNAQDIKPYTINYAHYAIGDSVYRNVNVSTRVNVGQEITTGINISGAMPVGDKLNFRTNIFVSNRHIINDLDTVNHIVNGFGYRINLNAGYQLPKDLVIELFGNYNSSFTNVQGRMPHFVSYNFALRKQFMKKNASIGFTTTNPFSAYVNQLTTVHGANFNTVNLRQVPYRSFGISLMYKFGKLEFKKDKQEDNLPAPIEN